MTSGIQISDIILPPEIKGDFQVRDISSQFQPQANLQASGVGSGTHTGAPTSSSSIHVTVPADEGTAPSDAAAQLVKLINASSTSSDNLAKAPLIDLLKHQAEQVPATAYQQTIPVWQLADDEHVQQALQQQIQQPGFGKESDAVCGWLYDWCRSGDPLLQRFVACIAPHLAAQYLLHCHSTTESEPLSGLEACLIAIYEVKTSTADIFRLPDVSQPSVYHQPTPVNAGKADEGLYRQTSSLLPVSPTYSILPSGVAALFGSNKPGQSKVMSGVHAWQRNAVAGAALQMFTAWMVTFNDRAMAGFAGLALSLASCGCPWLQAEAQRLLQEQVHTDAHTTHSRNVGPSHRLKLSLELLDPLCHALGHAIYRLAMATTQQSSSRAVGRQDPTEGAYQQCAPVSASGAASSGPQLLSLVAEAVAGLHVRTSYDVLAEGVLLTQSLMAQLHQFYHPTP